ncbi:MAG: hypothetical protein HYZ28_17640 [Myxococcales bacterium]|nr:hypothetical protein [Myxococcales bacterium]
MTPEIQRLQVLNDLVAQTIDVINQRAVLGQLAGQVPYAQPFGVPQIGLQHTPYQAIAQLPYVQQALQSRLGAWGQTPFTGVGFGQIPFAGAGIGLQHTPFTQASLLGQLPYGQAVQAGIGQVPLAGVGMMGGQLPYGVPGMVGGLQHTPFQVAQTWGIPQLPVTQLGYGIDPRLLGISPWAVGQRF